MDVTSTGVAILAEVHSLRPTCQQHIVQSSLHADIPSSPFPIPPLPSPPLPSPATSTFSWSQTSVAERSKVMLKIADLVEERLEEFAQAESQDQGKPVWLARTVDIPRACLNFRFFATSILHNVDM